MTSLLILDSIPYCMKDVLVLNPFVPFVSTLLWTLILCNSFLRP